MSATNTTSAHIPSAPATRVGRLRVARAEREAARRLRRRVRAGVALMVGALVLALFNALVWTRLSGEVNAVVFVAVALFIAGVVLVLAPVVVPLDGVGDGRDGGAER